MEIPEESHFLDQKRAHMGFFLFLVFSLSFLPFCFCTCTWAKEIFKQLEKGWGRKVTFIRQYLNTIYLSPRILKGQSLSKYAYSSVCLWLYVLRHMWVACRWNYLPPNLMLGGYICTDFRWQMFASFWIYSTGNLTQYKQYCVLYALFFYSPQRNF